MEKKHKNVLLPKPDQLAHYLGSNEKTNLFKPPKIAKKTARKLTPQNLKPPKYKAPQIFSPPSFLQTWPL